MDDKLLEGGTDRGQFGGHGKSIFFDVKDKFVLNTDRPQKLPVDAHKEGHEAEVGCFKKLRRQTVDEHVHPFERSNELE